MNTIEIHYNPSTKIFVLVVESKKVQIYPTLSENHVLDVAKNCTLSHIWYSKEGNVITEWI